MVKSRNGIKLRDVWLGRGESISAEASEIGIFRAGQGSAFSPNILVSFRVNTSPLMHSASASVM